MKQKYLLLATVILGSLLSTALAAWSGIDAQDPQWTTKSPVQDVNSFYIKNEISALLQAKRELDETLKTAGDDKQKAEAATQQFNNKKKDIFNGLAARRRAQYEQARFEVTRQGHAWIKDKHRPSAPPYYRIFIDYRIDSPKPDEWILIPGTCFWVENDAKRTGNSNIHISNSIEENNGYTVNIRGRGPEYGRPISYIDFTLYALYRYNDATITKQVDADMVRLKERVEEGVNK